MCGEYGWWKCIEILCCLVNVVEVVEILCSGEDQDIAKQ